MNLNDAMKAGAIPGAGQQAKPSDPAKTLGDMIRDALAKATAERGAEAAAEATCGCDKCAAERNMTMGPVTITGEGNEVEATLEKHPDDSFVLEVGGIGVDFVVNDNGGHGILFRSTAAMAEFFEFIDKVRP